MGRVLLGAAVAAVSVVLGVLAFREGIPGIGAKRRFREEDLKLVVSEHPISTGWLPQCAGLQVGEKVPDMELEDISGNVVHLTEPGTRAVIFLARRDCGSCVEYWPLLASWARRFGEDFRVIVVFDDSAIPEIARAASSIKNTHIVENTPAVRALLKSSWSGARTFLVNEEGAVAYHFGFAMYRWMEQDAIVAHFATHGRVPPGTMLPSRLVLNEVLPDIPGFEDLEGNWHEWSSFRGKPLLLCFTALGCEPCSVVYEFIEEIKERYGDKGLSVYYVMPKPCEACYEEIVRYHDRFHLDKSKLPPPEFYQRDIAAEAKARRLKVRIFLEPYPATHIRWQVTGIPRLILTDAEGRVKLPLAMAKGWGLEAKHPREVVIPAIEELLGTLPRSE